MSANTLLAYVSSGGATEGYARIIADTLRDHGYLLDIVDLRRDRVRDLSPYRNVILGTGVRIGMIYRKGKKFLRRKDLARKRLAVFLSSGIAVEDAVRSKEKFLDPMIRKYGLRPVLYDALPGKLPGPNNTLEDKTDAGLARQWAEELAIRLRDGG